MVVTGTGTGIGKTHVACACLHAWRRVLSDAGLDAPRVAGLKPVESGAESSGESDAATLERASTFHVKPFPPPYMLARAVSPHLAAREEGRSIELAVMVSYVENIRARADGVVLELPGGLFSPLGVRFTNADVIRELGATVVLLVAPDRLGVLHDVTAAARAAAAERVTLSGVVLVAPASPDASTGSNASELALVTDLDVLAVVPRDDAVRLAERADLRAVMRRLVRAPPTAPRLP